MSKDNKQPNEPNKNEPKKPKSRSYSINDIYAWKFTEQGMPTEWLQHIGHIDSRFTMYIDGEPGNGKTEYVLQFAKMLCNNIGKTRLNNVEQGKHTQIKTSVVRNDFKNTIPAGKFQYDTIRDYNEFKAKLKKPNSGRNIIIDSISYWPLGVKEIQELINSFKYKNLIFVAYKKHFSKNQEIIHMCDIKVRVENFFATVTGGRFGGTESYNVWPTRFASSSMNGQGSLFQPQPLITDAEEIAQIAKEVNND
jgi:predicted ATP-dependent serine protease